MSIGTQHQQPRAGIQRKCDRGDRAIGQTKSLNIRQSPAQTRANQAESRCCGNYRHFRNGNPARQSDANPVTHRIAAGEHANQLTSATHDLIDGCL